MKYILLTQGKQTTVDDEDFDWLNKYNWCYYRVGYAARGIRSRKEGWQKTIYMHQQIMNVNSDIDHINGDGLDNRRENLRIATHAENLRNRPAPISNTSGYKGVSWDKSRNKWLVSITVNYKKIHLGRYIDIKEAAKAYNNAVLKYFGDFGRLNTI